MQRPRKQHSSVRLLSSAPAGAGGSKTARSAVDGQYPFVSSPLLAYIRHSQLPPQMASSSSSTAVAALRRLATLRSQIFQTLPPPPASAPGGIRTGAKFLKAPLKGPSMLEYYPPTLKLKGLGERIWGQEGVERGLILMDPRERQRLEDVERRKKMGKGPPKKGKWRE